VTLTEALVWFLIFVIVSSIYWYLSIPKNLPPGSVGLPFVGNAIEYWDGRKQHLILQEKVKEYGPVFKLYIANKLVIVLGDYDAIQEAMIKQGDAFQGRPQFQAVMPRKFHGHGVIMSEGNLWKEQRRFALSTLRDFGVGRPLLESKIKEEIEYLVERITTYSDKGLPVDPQRLVTSAVSNIISQLIFGRRFSYDDEEFVRQFMGLSKRSSGDGVSFLSPFLLSDVMAQLLQFIPIVRETKKQTDEFIDFVEKAAEKTIATYDPEAEPNNYIHAFMKAANETKDSYFTNTQLMSVANDLFSAGTETTSTTIRWAILFLATHPDIQEKLYQEIKEQVGVSALPSYADKTKLPFAEAVVMETQRLSNLVPLGVFRRNLEPTKFRGYDLPAGTVVLPLLSNVLHNPDVFEDPLKFNPGRFIDANGKVIRDPKLIPFQSGKRVCLGEPLARMELFLLTVGLASRFRFYFREGQPVPTLKPIVGFTSTPVAYEVFVDARND